MTELISRPNMVALRDFWFRTYISGKAPNG
jgi:hypothetical protein